MTHFEAYYTNFTLQFKAKISPEFSNTPVEQLCLIFSGKIMKDHETLETHSIKDGMTVHLVIRSGGTSGGSSNQSQPNSQPEQNTGNPSQTPFGLGKQSFCEWHSLELYSTCHCLSI